MNATTRRWVTGSSIVILLAMGSSAWGTCAERAEQYATRFARRADHAAQYCVRRSQIRGTICPDARLTTRLERFRAAIVPTLGRHCPTAALEARLDALQDRVFCHRLARCESSFGSLRVTVESRSGDAERAAGSRRLAVDSGWTGIAHDLQILEGAGFTSELTGCDAAGDGRCELFGRTAGTAFGAPSPISAGGVAVCVTVDFASDVIGHVNVVSGDLTESAHVAVGVYVNGTIEEPCPACVPDAGDPEVGASGTCHGGSNVGGACIVGGLAGREYGRYRGTSGNCPPRGSPLATFRSAATATSGDVVFGAAQPCADGGDGCWCAGQRRANACADGMCTPTADGGICAAGPLDRRCVLQSYAGCIDDSDCSVPGDHCGEPVQRSCFPDPIRLSGTPAAPRDGVAHPTLVGVFCMASARNGSVDSVAGYPGPTTFVWPAEVVFDR